MIICEGYAIEQYPLQNRIVIALPQTADTIQDTRTMPQNRRVKLSSEELTEILFVVKRMYERRGEEDEADT